MLHMTLATSYKAMATRYFKVPLGRQARSPAFSKRFLSFLADFYILFSAASITSPYADDFREFGGDIENADRYAADDTIISFYFAPNFEPGVRMTRFKGYATTTG